MTDIGKTKPWYREPWPWFLMLGPFIVVVAAIYTAWLAVTTSDGLVAEDYYRQGLTVDKTIARSELARKLGLVAAMRMTGDRIVVRLSAPDGAFAAPAALVLTLSHPTRAGLDQTLRVERVGNAYLGHLRLPSSGHWLVLVEDDLKSWRLMGNTVLPTPDEWVIGAVVTETNRR